MPEETPVEPMGAVSMEVIVDGADWLKKKAAAARELIHPEQTSDGIFNILEVGQGAGNEILTGQFRLNKDGNVTFDGLATMDRLYCMAIQQCVVSPDGKPVWTPANILFMFSGPEAAKFREILDELYDLAVKWNPHVSPLGNANAHRRLRPWMA